LTWINGKEAALMRLVQAIALDDPNDNDGRLGVLFAYRKPYPH
jgi:hypothetical protein